MIGDPSVLLFAAHFFLAKYQYYVYRNKKRERTKALTKHRSFSHNTPS